MKRSEMIALIEAHRPEIIAEMKDSFEYFVKSAGSCHTQIYMYDDGEITTNTVTSSETSWLQASNPDIYDLFHIVTVGDHRGFDWLQFCDEPLPEDPDYDDFESDAEYTAVCAKAEAEYDRIRAEVEDWYISEYDADSELNRAIENLEADM